MIESARVPIVKFQHVASGLAVDVCFDQASSTETARVTRELLVEFAPLRPLLVVLKVFLRQRALAETYRGGIGSFLLLLMTTAFLQHFARVQRTKRRQWPNLGLLLLQFLRFFGTELNYAAVGLRIGGGNFFSKSRKGWLDHRRPWLLSVENPNDGSIDVGKSSWAVRRVKRAFEFGYHVVAAELAAFERSGGSGVDLLKSVIRVDASEWMSKPRPRHPEGCSVAEGSS